MGYYKSIYNGRLIDLIDLAIFGELLQGMPLICSIKVIFCLSVESNEMVFLFLFLFFSQACAQEGSCIVKLLSYRYLSDE